jgi:hypothetical protein
VINAAKDRPNAIVHMVRTLPLRDDSRCTGECFAERTASSLAALSSRRPPDHSAGHDGSEQCPLRASIDLKLPVCF